MTEVAFGPVAVLGPGAFPVAPRPSVVQELRHEWPSRKLDYDSQYSAVVALTKARGPRRWRVIYEYLSGADYNTLRGVWQDMGPDGWRLWIEPYWGERVRVRFVEPPHVTHYSHVDRFTVVLDLEEVL